MDWKFWKKKEEEPSRMGQLQEELATIHTQLDKVTDQVTKLTRVQFKSNKNIEEKMDDFAQALSDINSQHDAVTESQRFKEQQEFTMDKLIRLLDEMDHVSSGIKENERTWYDLLDQWSQSILQSLEQMNIVQLNVIGKSFNPKNAESVKTVSKDLLTIAPMAPYQVMEVLQRGYITSGGQLIRKAKVVTVKEEKNDGR